MNYKEYVICRTSVETNKIETPEQHTNLEEYEDKYSDRYEEEKPYVPEEEVYTIDYENDEEVYLGDPEDYL